MAHNVCDRVLQMQDPVLHTVKQGFLASTEYEEAEKETLQLGNWEQFRSAPFLHICHFWRVKIVASVHCATYCFVV